MFYYDQAQFYRFNQINMIRISQYRQSRPRLTGVHLHTVVLYTVFLIYLLYVYSGTRAHIAGIAVWFWCMVAWVLVWGEEVGFGFFPLSSFNLMDWLRDVSHRAYARSLTLFYRYFQCFLFCFFRTDCLVK